MSPATPPSPAQPKRRLGALLVLLAIAAAISAGIWGYSDWLRRRNNEIGTYIPKRSVITPEIRLLQQYVRIDTSNPPGRELAGARFLAGILERNGVRAEIIESAPGRGNLYARIRGRRSGEGLLLLHHIDVVPARPAGWSHPPFSGDIGLNMLFGRGSLDMKGIGICYLAAFLDVARSRKQPERDLVFLAVSDEEEGGALGTAWLLEHRPDIFEGIAYALNEGGITETQQEQLTYFGIEIGSKQAVKTVLRAPARESLLRTRIALEPFFAPRDPDRVLPEVKRFLREIAPLRTEQSDRLIDVDRTIAEGKFWLLPRGYRELTQNVVWAEGVSPDGHGGYEMMTYLFNLPDEQPDERVAWLERYVAPFGVHVEVLRKSGPTPLSPEDSPMFALLAQEARHEYGKVPVGSEILSVSYSDSRFIRQRGIACYGLFPFPVDFFQTQGIHGIDERIRLDWFAHGVAMTRRVVARWADGEAPSP
ncbi:MAG TPA: M20/M25/M40 family metallo-hydrolase [Thermoanaerobaculia bacterium]|nr:M20/M25/M40 family metallo-hydrolase [Thermoanaerobaculia bacterium]